MRRNKLRTREREEKREMIRRRGDISVRGNCHHSARGSDLREGVALSELLNTRRCYTAQGAGPQR